MKHTPKPQAMKKPSSLSIPALIFLLILAGSIQTYAQDLVAPEPPRAIESEDLNIRQFNNNVDVIFVQSYHTPLSMQEVVAFYREQLGDMEVREEGKHYRADIMEVEVKSSGILKVHAIPRNPGVSVKDIRSLNPGRCHSAYFRPFRDMSQQLEQYSRQDYQDVCARYGYLEYAYYGDSDQMGADGRPLTKDEVLYREYIARLEPESAEIHDLEEMSAEAQRLISQGRMEEARDIFEKISKYQQEALTTGMQGVPDTEQTEAADHWDEWIAFLQELDQLIYPTAVFIDVHPKAWPDDDWLHENIAW